MSVPANVYDAAVRLWIDRRQPRDLTTCCEWCAATFGTLPVGEERLAFWVLTWAAQVGRALEVRT